MAFISQLSAYPLSLALSTRGESTNFLSQISSHGHIVQDPFSGFIDAESLAFLIDMGNHFLCHFHRSVSKSHIPPYRFSMSLKRKSVTSLLPTVGQVTPNTV